MVVTGDCRSSLYQVISSQTWPLWKLLRRQRMMLMNNAPPATNLSETHGQSKFELFPLAMRVDARTPPYRRSEGHVFPGSDLHIVKVKSYWLLRPRQKLLPSRHVRIQPSRHEWRRHIEHQDLGVVVRANPRPVLFANRSSPPLYQCLYLHLILGRGFL